MMATQKILAMTRYRRVGSNAGEHVLAAKIVGFVPDHLTTSTRFILAHADAMTLTEEWCRRHNPLVGGYLVIADGDGTFVTADAFERGFAMERGE